MLLAAQCGIKKLLTAKPASVTFEQAAALPVAGLTALQGLRNAGKLVAGQSVLINGASGGVGTFAVQIAKTYGADVTAVCSTRNVGLVRDIGADTVIDYTLADFTRRGEHYDLIFDLADNHPLSDYRRVLTPKGIYVGAGMLGKGPPTIGLLPGILLGMITKLLLAPFISQKLPSFMAKVNEKDLAILGELVAAAKITPLIDRSFKLAATADAIQYVREKRARGKVVITVLDA